MSMGGRIGSKVGSEVWAAALPFFSVAAKSEKEEEGRVEVETLEEGTVGAPKWDGTKACARGVTMRPIAARVNFMLHE